MISIAEHDDVGRCLNGVQAAYRNLTGRRRPADFVPLDQSRALLRLFVKVKDEDLRQAILDLLRVIADGPPFSSGAPNAPCPSGANRPGTGQPA